MCSTAIDAPRPRLSFRWNLELRATPSSDQTLPKWTAWLLYAANDTMHESRAARTHDVLLAGVSPGAQPLVELLHKFCHAARLCSGANNASQRKPEISRRKAWEPGIRNVASLEPLQNQRFPGSSDPRKTGANSASPSSCILAQRKAILARQGLPDAHVHRLEGAAASRLQGLLSRDVRYVIATIR